MSDDHIEPEFTAAYDSTLSVAAVLITNDGLRIPFDAAGLDRLNIARTTYQKAEQQRAARRPVPHIYYGSDTD